MPLHATIFELIETDYGSEDPGMYLNDYSLAPFSPKQNQSMVEEVNPIF